ncbi:MAG: DUF493 family protein [Bacteriovoracaceae bacterium]
MEKDYDQFLEVLRAELSFPSYYLFKFIVKIEYKDQLIQIFGSEDVELNPSKNGNYVSVNCQKLVARPEQVVEIYKLASVVPGVIAL